MKKVFTKINQKSKNTELELQDQIKLLEKSADELEAIKKDLAQLLTQKKPKITSNDISIKKISKLLLQLRAADRLQKKEAELIEEKILPMEIELDQLRIELQEHQKKSQKFTLIQEEIKKMKISYEILISDINSHHQKQLSTLKSQLSAAKSAPAAGGRWMETSVLLATLFNTIYQKWLSMINIKCVFWELVEAVNDSFELDEESNCYKFFEVRKIFWAVIFTKRLSKISKRRKEEKKRLLEVQDDQNKLYRDKNYFELNKKRGEKMYEKIFLVSSFYNPSSLNLISILENSQSGEAALQLYFSQMVSFLYPTLGFKLLEKKDFEKGGFGEKEVEQKLMKANDLLKLAQELLGKKDEEIKRIKSNI